MVASYRSERIERVPVKEIAIDDLTATFCSTPGPLIFKIDVEGYESEVLKGMTRTLAASTATFGLLEFDARRLRTAGVDARAFLRQLEGQFQAFAVSSGVAPRPISDSDREKASERDPGDRFGTGQRGRRGPLGVPPPGLGVKTLGIIPARRGSKRLPGKNMRALGGRPLIAWVIDAALGCSSLSDLCVSSDDETVLEVARSRDPRLPLERPPALCTDTSLAIDYVRHALSVRGTFDAVVIVQCTSPFTTAADIEAVVELLAASGSDSAVSVAAIDFALHPAKLKTMDGDRLCPYLEAEDGRMAEHQLPKVYHRNGSVYATRVATIERGSLLGEDCRGYVMPRHRSVDINDERDFRFAEFTLQSAG